MMRAAKTLTLILALALFACGGSGTTDSTDTTSVDVTTTTQVETTVTSAEDPDEGEDNGSVSIDDMPQECIDVFVNFLTAMEPALEDFDFETATANDMQELGVELEAVTSEYATEIEGLECPDLESSDEEAFAAMIDIAEREAPGTVGYLEWIQSMATIDGSGGSATGDCESDIASLQSMIDSNTSMGELTMEEVVDFGALASSVSESCSAERASEFFSQEDVAAFMGG
jgi:hypothetical protein